MPVQSFHLAQHQRARVWSGEYPDAPLGSGPVLGDSLAARASEQAQAKTVAIEWLVPLGGYSMYALLGGTIRPQPEGVTLQVVTSPAPISKFESCLGRDQAWFGLPEEFAPSVLEGMRNAAQSHQALPGAAVLCNLAAFTEIGSSNLVFKVLGRAVVQLLLTPGTPDQNEIASLLTLEPPAGPQ